MSNIQFWRTDGFSDESLLDLITRTFGVTFSNVTDARAWLKNNGYFTTYPNVVTDGLVLSLDAQNTSSFRGEPTTNLSPITYEKTGSNEYLPYCSIVEIFDTYGTDGYYVSFEAKSPVPGQVRMYTADTASRKYSFTSQPFQITTNFEKYSLPITNITIYDAIQTVNRLSFYGTYGTGRIVTVKNLQIEQKTHSTQFIDGTRGTTCATGGGWCDLSGNDTNGEISANIIYDSSVSSLVFNGSNTRVTMESDLSSMPNTYEAWIKVPTTVADGTRVGNLIGNYPDSPSVQFEYFTLGRPRFYWNHGEINWIVSGIDIRTNSWTHVVFVRDTTAGEIYYYQNGIKLSTYSTSAGTTISNLNGWRIGDDSVTPRIPLNGSIGSIKLYSTGLTATEVLSNFNGTKTRFGL